MKIRSDFVTNSSSSSFIVAFKNIDDMEKSKDKMLDFYSSSIVNRIFDDIADNKISYKEAIEYLEEDLEFAFYAAYRWGYNSEYRTRPSKWFQSKEFKDMLKVKVDKELNNFKDNLKNSGIIAIVTYDDDSNDESLLQYDIMPNQAFVKKIISNH